jgi:LmbE family N-acetylglucosaminyl deacetylase
VKDRPAALAIAAHPDDIELMMAGTLALLGQAGYALHLLNVANGCCGSQTQDAAATAARRWEEAQAAARILGAEIHPPLANDLEIFYEDGLIRKVAAVVRRVRPRVILTQPPVDYMEDHMNTCRIAVTAAFVRGMPNYASEPPLPAIGGEVTLYHALPWGLQGPLGEAPKPTHFVEVGSVMALKKAALAAHVSQKEWLDRSQGLDSYIAAMVELCGRMGAMSGVFSLAEGWTRHLHLGFCAPEADPLVEALGEKVLRHG